MKAFSEKTHFSAGIFKRMQHFKAKGDIPASRILSNGEIEELNQVKDFTETIRAGSWWTIEEERGGVIFLREHGGTAIRAISASAKDKLGHI